MARSFFKLFDLEILHDYYISGKSDDFLIEATPETLKLIKGYRSVLKSVLSETGKKGITSLSVVYEATDALLHTPLIPITEAVRFRFFMKLANPVFLNFTELEVKNNSSEIYYYTNSGGAILAQTLMELQPKFFDYKFNSLNSPDQLRVFGIDGIEITALRKDLAGGPDFEVSLDLQNYPDGKYRLELFADDISIGEFKDIYFDNNLKTEGVFGIIEVIKDNNNFPFDELKIQFVKGENFWKYFVVLKEGIGTDTYTVEDAEDGGPFITFSIVPQVIDEEDEEPDFTLQDKATIDALLSNYPNGDVVMFKSAAEVNYTEVRKKEIQLKRTSSPAAVLIKNLPNPEVGNPKAEAFVFV